MPDLPLFDAVVVAGGRAERLGGIDKAELVFRGDRLLDRVVEAVLRARQVVVVGPSRATTHAVTWTQEEPDGGGPVAALDAGLALVRAPFVVVVAVDLPLLERALVRTLVNAADERSAAVAIDGTGKVQPLLACYPTPLLRAAVEQKPAAGGSMMGLLERIPYRTVPDEGRARDCDTLFDIEELQIERGTGHAGELA